MSTVKDALHRIESHERECALRYKNIENRLDEGSEKFKRLESMLEEIGALKDKIRELEDDKNVNPHQKWIHLARAVDSWRIFPRVFLSVYIFLLYYSTMWFMALDQPSLEQSGLISIIVGAGAAWFGLYAGTSNSSKSFKGEDK